MLMLEKIVFIARNLSKKQTKKQTKTDCTSVMLTVSESFAGAGFRNPGRWTVPLEIPMQPSSVARTTTGASSEEARETEGAEVHGSANNISYKKTVRETWWTGPPGWSDSRVSSTYILEFLLD